jgi:hypothetical protein
MGEYWLERFLTVYPVQDEQTAFSEDVRRLQEWLQRGDSQELPTSASILGEPHALLGFRSSSLTQHTPVLPMTGGLLSPPSAEQPSAAHAGLKQIGEEIDSLVRR